MSAALANTEYQASYMRSQFGVDMGGDAIQYVNWLNGTRSKAVLHHFKDEFSLVLSTEGSTVMEYIEVYPDKVTLRFRLLATKEVFPGHDPKDVYEAIERVADINGMLHCFDYMDKSPILPDTSVYLAFDTQKQLFCVIDHDRTKRYFKRYKR